MKEWKRVLFITEVELGHIRARKGGCSCRGRVGKGIDVKVLSTQPETEGKKGFVVSRPGRDRRLVYGFFFYAIGSLITLFTIL
jgi:hypothetical protein